MAYIKAARDSSFFLLPLSSFFRKSLHDLSEKWKETSCSTSSTFLFHFLPPPLSPLRPFIFKEEGFEPLTSLPPFSFLLSLFGKPVLRAVPLSPFFSAFHIRLLWIPGPIEKAIRGFAFLCLSSFPPSPNVSILACVKRENFFLPSPFLLSHYFSFSRSLTSYGTDKEQPGDPKLPSFLFSFSLVSVFSFLKK